jgi:hypothetical protein
MRQRHIAGEKLRRPQYALIAIRAAETREIFISIIAR